MKALFLALNARYYHSNIALRYIREYVKSSDCRVVLEELTINTPLREIVKCVYDHSPDALFISVYIWNSSLVKNLVREISSLMKCRIYLGGPEVSFNAVEWIRELSNITVIAHAGEEAVKHIIDSKFKNDDKIITFANPPFDGIPFPYTEEELSSAKNKILYYESSRGCAFSCSYCLSSSYSFKIDLRNIERVKSEISRLASCGCAVIKFIDRTFNYDSKRAVEIIRHISQLETEAVFHLELHPEFISDEFVETLEDVPEGRLRFEIGFQSANEKTLSAVNRYQNAEKSVDKIRRITKLNKFHVHADLIAGLPYENYDSFKKTFNHLASAHPDNIQLGFLKILPGTRIESQKNIFGIKHFCSPPYEVIETNDISFAEVSKLHDIDSVLDSVYNCGHFRETVKYLSAETTLFDLIESLLRFAYESGFDIKTKNWKDVSSFILNYCRNNSLDAEMISDYLCYDFITSKINGMYPSFLFPLYETIKHKCLGILKTNSGKHYSLEGIASKEYTKFLFFSPRSKLFPETLCGQNEIIALYKERLFRIG
ncbi:MAG: DUF4080 domain-containing protein [Spirochaetes bacterium]|nr:DUF4080 domain-containing protein [Spirochaetota bacterium]